MKKQLIAIVVTVLLVVAILISNSTLIASPVSMILFGISLLGIVEYARKKQKHKEYPSRKPNPQHPL